MFTTTAYAETTDSVSDPTASQSMFSNDMLMQILPFAIIFVVFYFLLLRPQQMAAKTHKATIDALKRGDEVVTDGGIIGKIHRIVDDKEVIVTIADGVHVRMNRAKISGLFEKDKKEGASTKAEKTIELEPTDEEVVAELLQSPPKGKGKRDNRNTSKS